MPYHEALSFHLLEGSQATALLTLDISHTLQEGYDYLNVRYETEFIENTREFSIWSTCLRYNDCLCELTPLSCS